MGWGGRSQAGARKKGRRRPDIGVGGTGAAVLCQVAVRGEVWNRMERDVVVDLIRALGGACEWAAPAALDA